MGSYHRAGTVGEACRFLDELDDAALIAGGQTVTLNLRHGLLDPGALVDIAGVDGLRGIERRDDGGVGIGAGVTYTELGANDAVRETVPVLAAAVDEIAGPAVRNNATVGGGVCAGDPALDLPPALLALDAHVRLRSSDGERSLPLDEFYTGYYETALEPGEVLTRVEVPAPSPRSGAAYRTMTPRSGDYAVAGVCVRLDHDAAGACETARIALTNAGDTTMRAGDAETRLEGAAIDEAAAADAADAVVDAVDVLDDPQVPASYRETVFRRLADRTILDVTGGIDG